MEESLEMEENSLSRASTISVDSPRTPSSYHLEHFGHYDLELAENRIPEINRYSEVAALTLEQRQMLEELLVLLKKHKALIAKRNVEEDKIRVIREEMAKLEQKRSFIRRGNGQLNEATKAIKANRKLPREIRQTYIADYEPAINKYRKAIHELFETKMLKGRTIGEINLVVKEMQATLDVTWKALRVSWKAFDLKTEVIEAKWEAIHRLRHG